MIASAWQPGGPRVQTLVRHVALVIYPSRCTECGDEHYLVGSRVCGKRHSMTVGVPLTTAELERIDDRRLDWSDILTDVTGVRGA